MVAISGRKRPPVPASQNLEGPGASTTEESGSTSPNLAGNESHHGDGSSGAIATATATTPVPGNNNVDQQKSPASNRKRQHAVISTVTAAAPNESAALVFPPTIFTDAIYSAGIRIAAGTAADAAAGADEEVQTLLVPPTNYIERDTGRLATRLSKKDMEWYHYQKIPPRAPSLSNTERKLWSHHVAAKHAAQRHFPAETCRLLGAITRTVIETCNSDDDEIKVKVNNSSNNTSINESIPLNNHDRKNKKSKRSNKKTKLEIPEGGQVKKVKGRGVG